MRNIEDYTEKYLISNFEDYQVKYRRKKILEILKKNKHSRILEIGCGMEPLFKYIDNQEFDKYVIFEPSIVFYKNACKEASSFNNIECINDYFSASEQIKNNHFDFIICSGLLHEVENPKKMLYEIYDVCKDALVHINVPNANSFHRILAKQAGLIQDIHDFSERNIQYQQNSVFDINSLKELVKASGFYVEEEGSYFIKPFTHQQMQQMITNNIIDETILEGLFYVEQYTKEHIGSEIYVNVRRGKKIEV